MHPVWGALGFVVGAVISSFGATWALRKAQGQAVIAGRSRCDQCLHVLSYAETVPVASYLVLKGRCHHCKGSIPSFHTMAEILGGSLLAAILMLRPWPLAVIEAALAICLLVLALVDLKTLTLPNAGVAIAAVISGVLGWLSGAWLENLAVAGLLGLGLSALAFSLKRVRRRTMLGGGDIKLLVALSLWLGPDIFIALAAGSMLGLLQIRLSPARNELIPFGPAIMVGSLVMGLCVRPWFSLGGVA